MCFLGEQAKKSFIINVIFLSFWIAIFIIATKFLLGYMLPFVIAVCVATAMQKPAKSMEKLTRIPKGICATVLSAVLYILLAAGIIFGIMRFSVFAGNSISSLSTVGNSLTDLLSRFENALGVVLRNISPDFEDNSHKILSAVLSSVTERASVFLSNEAAEIVRAAPSFLFSSVVALAASCYIAKDFDALVEFIKNLLGNKTVKTVSKIAAILKSSVLKMIGGYLILMLLTFFELGAGLLLLRVKNWLIISFIIAVIDVLPALGVGAVLLPWGIINIVLGNRSLGIWLMILYLIITIVRNFAEPKIVGSKMGINPLFILFTMFLGIKIFGFAGLIILPVTFIVVIKYYKNEMEIESSP